MMDVDWCFCGKRIDGKGPYCSRECYNSDKSSPYPMAFESFDSTSSSDAEDDSAEYYSERRHGSHTSSRPSLRHAPYAQQPTRWAGNDRDGIMAWARDIPRGCGAPEAHDTPDMRPRPPAFPLSRQRPVPPALCMSTTQTQTPAQASRRASPAAPMAAGRRARATPTGSVSSLVSALTDSIATPVSDGAESSQPAVARPGMLDGIAARFRSWGGSSQSPVLQQPQQQRARTPVRFTVLSTTHETDVDADESELFYSAPAKEKEWAGTYGRGEAHPGRVWIAPAKAKDNAYAKRERAPVSLKVERVECDDHPAYRTRGRKTSRMTKQ